MNGPGFHGSCHVDGFTLLKVITKTPFGMIFLELLFNHPTLADNPSTRSWKQTAWRSQTKIVLPLGSSKWPSLDPQVIISGYKWPPFEIWGITRSLWKSWVGQFGMNFHIDWYFFQIDLEPLDRPMMPYSTLTQPAQHLQIHRASNTAFSFWDSFVDRCHFRFKNKYIKISWMPFPSAHI